MTALSSAPARRRAGMHCLACPVCGGTSQSLGAHPDFAESQIRGCTVCEVMFATPMPETVELTERYGAAYRAVRQQAPTEAYVASADARASAQRAFLARVCPSVSAARRILDVGCAAGSLLYTFREQAELMTGFEPDGQMAAAAQARLGAQAVIYAAPFDVRGLESDFDLICASHVLEHVPDCVGFLEALLEQLAPRGRLFLEVPQDTRRSVCEQIASRVRGLLHVWFFQPETLRCAVQWAGGRVTALTTFGPSAATFSHVPAARRGTRWGRAFRRLWPRGQHRCAAHGGQPDVFTTAWLNRENGLDGIWIRALVQKQHGAG